MNLNFTMVNKSKTQVFKEDRPLPPGGGVGVGHIAITQKYQHELFNLTNLPDPDIPVRNIISMILEEQRLF
jgi:hypothetical protein